MRRVQRGWCLAAAVGLWVCACSGSDPYASAGTNIPDNSFASGGTGGGPSITIAGKGGAGKARPGGPTRIVDICPEFGAAGGIVVGFGGSAPVGVGGIGATGGAGAGMGGAHGLDDPSQGGVAAGGSDGTLVPCPSEPPIDEQGQACAGPGICPYVDGSTCSCEPCADGWCWSCAVAELPFGCPRVPPKQGESCAWTGAVCSYGDCNRWDNTLAGCCLGNWRVSVDDCVVEP